MRIMHLLNHTYRLNGHVHAAVDLACEQRRLGHDVCIASGGGDFDQLLESNHVATRIVDHERRALTVVRSVLALRRHVREWKPDVVHAHMMTSAVIAYPVCKLSGIPLVTTVHNEFEKSAILMGLGTRVIAVSESVSRSMQQRGISAKKLHVVLNGTIGTARFANREAVAADLSHPNIVFVGGLHPRKGVIDLIQAFKTVYATYPAARLFIIGSGPMENEYRELARQTGYGDAITFLGAVADPYPYMLAADIFVLPSLADPAPLVISEAREARCAVIGTTVDGIPQLLEFGEAGMLVPPAAPDMLATALAELLADPANLLAWQEKSQLRIDNLTIERVALETTAVYRSAMTKPKLVVAASLPT
ncbi:glycosyltransferase family 4 protein [Aliirhizobium smilacinae]|uniref:Glycosyltransferase family 4 protein n=1 Tax=Aliirhizobium smilacinae TaxID=1395944 RepID=A0A5C4XT08_9HYPH|nr:glycosyltransferase family 4 protein [Rhizobium smilacinae]TNM65834.1 glycosyltransferase family 4 protein [Rhizobium smilacinae]